MVAVVFMYVWFDKRCNEVGACTTYEGQSIQV